MLFVINYKLAYPPASMTFINGGLGKDTTKDRGRKGYGAPLPVPVHAVLNVLAPRHMACAHQASSFLRNALLMASTNTGLQERGQLLQKNKQKLEFSD